MSSLRIDIQRYWGLHIVLIWLPTTEHLIKYHALSLFANYTVTAILRFQSEYKTALPFSDSV